MKRKDVTDFIRGLMMALAICLIMVGGYFWNTHSAIKGDDALMYAYVPALLSWAAVLRIAIWLWDHRKDNDSGSGNIDQFYQGR